MPWSGCEVVRVEVLAVEEVGDVEHLLPGLGRHGQVVADGLLELGLPARVAQDVTAVVEHLPVGVVQHAVALAVPGVELTDRVRHGVVGPARILPARQQVVDGADQVGADQLAVEERGTDGRVVLPGATPPVEHHGRVDVGDRLQAELDLGPGQLLEHRRPRAGRRSRRAALVLAQDAHGGAGERVRVRPGEQGAQLVAAGLDDRVVAGRPELEQHGAVVEPVDVLARAGGLSERDEAHQGGHEAPLPRAHRSLRLSLRHQPLRFGSDHVNEKSMANTSPMS